LGLKVERISVALTALAAVGGLWYSTYSINQVNDELQISKEGQITDRYTAAVGNLGSDATDVRLGGVYALQRIMEDSTRDHPTIANILATYVQTHADKPWKKGEEAPPDVRAAFTVLATRDSSHDDGFQPDLHSVHLPRIKLPEHATLTNADLTGADLTGAQLGGVEMVYANLSGARLNDAELGGADLTGAGLVDAKLSNAYMYDADLHGAHLDGARLIDAKLGDADLTGAGLVGANLRGAGLIAADLSQAQLQGAQLHFAQLGSASLMGAQLTNAELKGAVLTKAKLLLADLTDADLTDADLTGADLTGALVTVQEILPARISATTKLPPDLAKHPAVRARIAEVEEEARLPRGQEMRPTPTSLPSKAPTTPPGLARPTPSPGTET
jgi:uncharacterized protein YjbI with pentapeptide repeats